MRTAKYYDEDTKSWVSVEFQNIVSGTLVRLFEADGGQLQTSTGVYEMYVISDAYQNDDEVWQIDIEDPEDTPVAKTEE